MPLLCRKRLKNRGFVYAALSYLYNVRGNLNEGYGAVAKRVSLRYMEIGMKGFGLSALRCGIQLAALLSAFSLVAPTAALAQTEAVDRAFLDSLYGFLQGQDNLAYIAAGQVGDASNVWLAQGICIDFENGLNPTDGYNIMIDTALSQLQGLSDEAYEEASYSMALYGGSMMNLGAAYYCPQYQPAVEQALRSL